jgi:hypothetical protein
VTRRAGTRLRAALGGPGRGPACRRRASPGASARGVRGETGRRAHRVGRRTAWKCDSQYWPTGVVPVVCVGAATPATRGRSADACTRAARRPSRTRREGPLSCGAPHSCAWRGSPARACIAQRGRERRLSAPPTPPVRVFCRRFGARHAASVVRRHPHCGPRRAFVTMGDVQAGGISKLLQAETLAQEIVNRARKGAHLGLRVRHAARRRRAVHRSRCQRRALRCLGDACAVSSG